MKKILCLMLSLLTVLALFACGSETASPEETETITTEKQFMAGYGRENITPDKPLTLGGSGTHDRVSEGTLDFLYVTCVAVTDEKDQTVLLITHDFLNADDSYVVPAKEKISEATGVPFENIMVSGTHTHSAPSITNEKLPGMLAYREVYYKAVVKACQTALDDRSPATVRTGSVWAKGMAFSRQYILPDGTMTNNAAVSLNPVGHPDDPDQESQLIRFVRADEEKKDILVMNYPIHATFNGSASDKYICSDAPGSIRYYIEKKADIHVAYFIAAAGNQVPDSKLKEEKHGLDWEEYGQALGKVIVDYLPQLKTVNSGDIQLKKEVFTATVNQDKQDMLPQAKEIMSAYSQGGTKASNPLVEQYGLSSVWEAQAIVNRSKMGETVDMNLNAVAFGDVSFIFAPYEMFAPTGMYIKENSVYDMTFVVTCANGNVGYLPTDPAYDYGVYESFVTRVVRGTAEDVADTFLNMLKELKQ